MNSKQTPPKDSELGFGWNMPTVTSLTGVELRTLAPHEIAPAHARYRALMRWNAWNFGIIFILFLWSGMARDAGAWLERHFDTMHHTPSPTTRVYKSSSLS